MDAELLAMNYYTGVWDPVPKVFTLPHSSKQPSIGNDKLHPSTLMFQLCHNRGFCKHLKDTHGIKGASARTTSSKKHMRFKESFRKVAFCTCWE